ncbi:MAG: hypothetical protein HGA76_07205 [Candidatus Firestonebacteria bacterium]|nr:hypothetical protein [Candidatus Firestonebacteria bacterium]
MDRTGCWIGVVSLVGVLLGVAACHQRRAGVMPAENPASVFQGGQVRAAGKHAALGDDYFQRRRTGDALAEWRLALDLDPSRRDVAEKIANLEKSGAFSENFPSGGTVAPADEDLGRRIAQALSLALKHYQASRLKEAELAYREVILLDPANTYAQKGLDRLREETYAADARRLYDQVTVSLYQDGMRLYREKIWDQAEVKLQEAAKLNPDQPQVKKFLERTHAEAVSQRDLVRSRQLAAQALKAETNRDWLLAFSSWQEAARMLPPPPEAAAGLSRSQREVEALTSGWLAEARKSLAAENFPAAQDGFEKVLAIFPENAEAWSGSKKARAGADRLKKSRSNPLEAQRFYNRGVEAYRRGDLTQAVTSWENAAAVDPQDAGIREALGRAKKERLAAQEKNRRLAQTRYADGLAAYQRGEFDEALAAWKETLELDPGHTKARGNIQRVEQEMK